MSASLSLLNLCSIIEIAVFLTEVNLIGRVEANCRVHLSERRRGRSFSPYSNRRVKVREGGWSVYELRRHQASVVGKLNLGEACTCTE